MEEYTQQHPKHKFHKCVVLGCKDEYTSNQVRSTHIFPLEGSGKVTVCKGDKKIVVDRRKAWLDAITFKQGMRDTTYMYICNRHFKQSDYFPVNAGRKGRSLKRDAVPSLNLHGKLPSDESHAVFGKSEAELSDIKKTQNTPIYKTYVRKLPQASAVNSSKPHEAVKPTGIIKLLPQQLLFVKSPQASISNPNAAPQLIAGTSQPQPKQTVSPSASSFRICIPTLPTLPQQKMGATKIVMTKPVPSTQTSNTGVTMKPLLLPIESISNANADIKNAPTSTYTRFNPQGKDGSGKSKPQTLVLIRPRETNQLLDTEVNEQIKIKQERTDLEENNTYENTAPISFVNMDTFKEEALDPCDTDNPKSTSNVDMPAPFLPESTQNNYPYEQIKVKEEPMEFEEQYGDMEVIPNTPVLKSIDLDLPTDNINRQSIDIVFPTEYSNLKESYLDDFQPVNIELPSEVKPKQLILKRVIIKSSNKNGNSSPVYMGFNSPNSSVNKEISSRISVASSSENAKFISKQSSQESQAFPKKNLLLPSKIHGDGKKILLPVDTTKKVQVNVNVKDLSKVTQDASQKLELLPETSEFKDDKPGENAGAVVFKLYCRICARITPKATSIFSIEGKIKGLAEKMDTFLGVKVKEGDQLPLRVCESCEIRLSACQQLRDTCMDAEKTFKMLLDCKISGLPNDTSVTSKGPLDVSETDIDSKMNNVITEDYENTSNSQSLSSKEHQTIKRRNTTPQEIGWECKICLVNFKSTIKLLADHYQYAHRKYMCRTCFEYFDSMSEKLDHIHENHNEPCPFCSTMVFNVKQHVRDFHKAIHPKFVEVVASSYYECIACKVCGKNVGNKYTAKYHYFWEHYQYACDVCLELFPKSEFQEAHTEEVHLIPCLYCHEVFYSQRRLQRHIGSKHKKNKDTKICHPKSSKKIYECQTCNKGITTKLLLKRHNFWCHNKFSCDFCTEEFTSLEKEEEHFAACHSKECSMCFETFSSQHKLTEHTKSQHSGWLPYSCENCGQYFSDRGELCIHRLSHEPDKSFLCEFCGKTFKIKTNLQLHQKYEHKKNNETYKFQCKLCDKRFVFQSQLKRHLEMHDKQSEARKNRILSRKSGSTKQQSSLIKKLTCDYCNKKFKKLSLLKKHIDSIHDSNLKYRCNACNEVFSSKKDIDLHILTHAAHSIFGSVQDGSSYVIIANFQCDFCDLLFSTKDELRSHIKDHLIV